MKFNKNTHFYIAKNIMDSVFTQNQPMEYERWVDFIEKHQEEFIWKENTEDGKKSLQNINNVPEDFRDRVLASLNKVVCFKEFDNNKEAYNISVSFTKSTNWISIQFARTPKPEDLEIFIEMANHLDALLLVDRINIVNEETLKDLS